VIIDKPDAVVPLSQQVDHLAATLAKATGQQGQPGLPAGTKGAFAHLDRQIRFHPEPTIQPS